MFLLCLRKGKSLRAQELLLIITFNEVRLMDDSSDKTYVYVVYLFSDFQNREKLIGVYVNQSEAEDQRKELMDRLNKWESDRLTIKKLPLNDKYYTNSFLNRKGVVLH